MIKTIFFPTPHKNVWTFKHENNNVYLLISFEAPRRDFKTSEDQCE